MAATPSRFCSSSAAKKRRTTALFSSLDMALPPCVPIHALPVRLLARVPVIFAAVNSVSRPVNSRVEDDVRREDLHLWFPGDAELLDPGHQPVPDEGIKGFG